MALIASQASGQIAAVDTNATNDGPVAFRIRPTHVKSNLHMQDQGSVL